jgi:hypothetical protein
VSSRWLTGRWLTVVRWVVTLAVVGLAGRELLRGWDQLRAQSVSWSVRPVLLVASVLVVWLMYALLIQAWRVMLRGWHQELRWWRSARIWTVSSLGKYVPGKVWAIAGMALMAQRAGVAAWAATASAVVLQALAVGSGAAVTGAMGTAELEAMAPWTRVALWGLIVAAALGLVLLLWPPVTRRLLRLARVEVPAGATPGPAAVAFGLAANVIAWCGYGVGLWLLARGLLDAPALGIGHAIGAFAASYVAGLLALPAPGGIGVREVVFYAMLDGVVGPANAVALAIASRLQLTLTELGAAAPFLLSTKEPDRGPG